MIKLPRFDNRITERFAARVPAKAENGLKIVAADASPDAVDVLLYDEIGYWGVTAKDFITALAGIKAGTINLKINSPGGDVFAGIAMFNAIQQHPATVNVTVDGLAASAASIVAMGGDTIRMNTGSFLMIHRAWTVGVGNSVELADLAAVLGKVDTSIAAIYAARTGDTADAMLGLMDEETWFTAEEAVDAKLADDVSESPAAKAAFDLSIFNHAPEPLVAAGRQKKTPRELEALLRDEGGLSNAEAKRLVAAAKPARLRDEDLADLANVFRSHRS